MTKPSTRADYFREYNKKNLVLRRFQTRNRLHLKRCGHKTTDVTFETWNKLKSESDFKCVLCERKESKHETLCMDHVIPPKLGGKHILENIQPLCVYCNSTKGRKVRNYKGIHEIAKSRATHK